MERALRIQRIGEIVERKNHHADMEITYQGETVMKPVHKIDLEYLIYNKYNGRISSLVKSHEAQYGDLNPEKDQDVKMIERFLWDSHPTRNKATAESLKESGQLKYGIVTRDGVIVDGNRRALLLQRNARESNESPVYFKAVILDETIEDASKEIMKLETIYQMGEDEKLGYGPIEKYLKCKDLKNSGFEDAEIGKMMGETESKVKSWLQIMSLMDDYLNNLKYKDIYTRLDNTEGIFVDLNNYLNRYDLNGNSGSRTVLWNYDEQDLADLKLIHFDYIRARFGGDGKDYRFIGRPSQKGKKSFFANEEIWKGFADEHFDKIEPINTSEKSVDQLRQERPDANLEKILKARDVDWLSKVEPHIKRNIGQSKRKLEDINEQNAPAELLRRAKNTLDAINVEHESFYEDEEVEELINQINQTTYNFKKLIKRARR